MRTCMANILSVNQTGVFLTRSTGKVVNTIRQYYYFFTEPVANIQDSFDEEACWNEDESLDSPQCDEYGALSGKLSASKMDVTRMYDSELVTL